MYIIHYSYEAHSHEILYITILELERLSPGRERGNKSENTVMNHGVKSGIL